MVQDGPACRPCFPARFSGAGARALEEREQRQREQADRQQDAAVGRLDEVLRALWGCRAGEWDG